MVPPHFRCESILPTLKSFMNRVKALGFRAIGCRGIPGLS
jgi:hypothetical protein